MPNLDSSELSSSNMDPEKGSDVPLDKNERATPIPLRKLARTFTTRFTKGPEALSGLHARARRHIKSRIGHVFDIDEASVFEATQHHINYTYNGTSLSGLTKYDDCTDYGISEDGERELLQIEVRRLIRVAQDNEAFLFSSNELLTEINKEGKVFQEVSHLADQIFCNMEIIRHDNARISLEHCPDDVEETIGHFKRSRRVLMSRFRQDQTRVKGSLPKILEPEARNQQLYFALVDYIIGCVARVLVRTATSNYWHQQCLSVLAQWSTKLKILSYDPVRYANFCLDNGESAVEQQNSGYATKQAFFLKIRLGPDSSQQKDVETLETETDVSGRYYREKTFFRKHLRYLVRDTIRSLRNPDVSSTAASCFETCAVIYRTGLDSVLTTLCNDRSGQISACSDTFGVKCAYTALELVVRNIQHLPPRSAPDSGPSANELTTLKLEWPEVNSSKSLSHTQIFISSMDDLMSVVGPMTLISAYCARSLDNLVGLAGSGTDDEDPIVQFDAPPKEFGALLTVSTADWRKKERCMSQGNYRDDDIRPVSLSPMRLGIRAGTNMLRALAMDEAASMGPADSHTEKILARYKKYKSVMDNWVIAEETVTIECRFYVRMIIAIAVIIVGGGMAVPFVVGTRIKGVDPFQIAAYSWVVAGFITIIAKSRYVSEWPWHDFLRGHVICRSVKDVCDVTRVNSQVVLMYLFLEESMNTLRTKGPYNGMFERKAEGSDGFAIDEAVHLSTMLASGYIILKVLNEFGEHLICLDVRKGSKGSAPLLKELDEHLACEDFDKDADGNVLAKESSKYGQNVDDAKGFKRVKKLQKVKFRYNKVLGLYIGNAKFG